MKIIIILASLLCLPAVTWATVHSKHPHKAVKKSIHKQRNKHQQHHRTAKLAYKRNLDEEDPLYDDVRTDISIPNLAAINQQSPPLATDKMQSLIDYATSLEGVSYRFAGESPNTGFDCSGYVQYVYKHEFGILLPHNAAAISRIGNKIPKMALRPGDLVLFNTLRRTFSHIGIYLGDHLFIHASGNKTGSVAISDLRNRYWARHFTGARRLELAPYT